MYRVQQYQGPLGLNNRNNMFSQGVQYQQPQQQQTPLNADFQTGKNIANLIKQGRARQNDGIYKGMNFEKEGLTKPADWTDKEFYNAFQDSKMTAPQETFAQAQQAALDEEAASNFLGIKPPQMAAPSDYAYANNAMTGRQFVQSMSDANASFNAGAPQGVFQQVQQQGAANAAKVGANVVGEKVAGEAATDVAKVVGAESVKDVAAQEVAQKAAEGVAENAVANTATNGVLAGLTSVAPYVGAVYTLGDLFGWWGNKK